MDYPFFVWRIGSIESKLLDQISDWCQTAKWHNAEGFDPRHKLTQQENDNGWDSIKKIITDEVIKQIGSVDIVDVNINRMAPHSFIAEHSDITSYGSNIQDYSWMPLRTHTIHIPITTNPTALHKHRRSQNSTYVTVSHLERGGIYLYNNVAWHSVHNDSDEIRTHCFIKARDDAFFTTKHRLLADNKCPIAYEYKAANFNTFKEPFDSKNVNTVVKKWFDHLQKQET
jgi:hypothetical protein